MNKIQISSRKKKIVGEVMIPSSKSYTNRSLIMAALAGGKSIIKQYSKSEDSQVMVKALEKLGIKIITKKNQIEVYGKGGKFKKTNLILNVNQAGTAMRFLTALCALVPGKIILDGSSRMRERPIGELVKALMSLGVKITFIGKKNCPPLKIGGGQFIGGEVEIKGSISSQFITSLLLIGPVLKNGLRIKIEGKQISRSYIDMTIDSMKKFGVKVKNNNYMEYIIAKEEKYQPTSYTVEGDASGASYFWGLAAITEGKIRVNNINPNSVQGDVHFVDVLEKMGCKVIKNSLENWIEVTGPKKLKPINIDMSLMPDTAQTLSVVCSFIKGKSKITGLSTLKIKETDRLQALHDELQKMNIKTTINNDSIIINGGKPKGTEIETYNDHRMAMAFSIAGAKISGMTIKNPQVVKKSYPSFWGELQKLGFKIKSL